MNLEVKRLSLEKFVSSSYDCSPFLENREGEDSLREFLADPNSVLLVAAVNGEPAGQITGHIMHSWDSRHPVMFINTIDVLKEYRLKGIGGVLIRELNRLAVENNCLETFVLTDESNTPALNLYQSAGGAKVYPDDVMFVWSLE